MRSIAGLSLSLALGLGMLALVLVLAVAPPSAAAPASSDTLVISEVQTGSATDASLEFIEIYNKTGDAIALDGYKVVYRSATGTTDVTVYTFGAGDAIPAQGHFLLVHTGFSVGVAPDATFGASLARTGGGLALRDPGSAIVDSLGWGSATNAFVEGTAATYSENDQSMERKPGGALGNGTDTDNNLADFQILTTPNPQNTSSPATPPLPTRGLSIEKSAPAAVEVSQRYTYTLVATNRISDTAVGLVITDALPAELEIATISDDGIHLGGNLISWTVPSLANEASVTRTVAVTAPAAPAVLWNAEYGVRASNWLTPAAGTAVQTRINLPGGLTAIYQIQHTTDPSGNSPLAGQVVTTTGVVYAVYGQGFAIAEASGPWHGIYVFNQAAPKPQVGDRVQVRGTVQEYYNMTELGAGPTHLVLSGGHTPYPASVVQTADIATGSPAAEQYEGVLVAAYDVTVTNADLGYGEWEITDSSGTGARVDDWASYDYAPALNNSLFMVRGMLNYSFDDFKLEPRGDEDIVATRPIGLQLSKSGPTNVAPGAEMTYTLSLDNYTGLTVTAVTVTDVVPANAAYARALDGGTLNGDTVSWTIPSLADMASATVRLVVTAANSPGESIVNDAYAAWASNWPTPTAGSPVYTFIGDYTPIYFIQGDGPLSSLEGNTVKTAGVAVGFFQGNYPGSGTFDGFFLQDPAGDGLSATSDAIFVNHGTLAVSVSAGDRVTVTGVVQEFSEYDGAACPGSECMTQIAVSAAGNVQVGEPEMLPATLELDPPGDPDLASLYWESLEGMPVTLPSTATVVGPTSFGTVMAVRSDLGVERVIRTGPYAGMPVGVRHWERYGEINGADPANLIVGSVIDNAAGPLAYSYGAYLVTTQAGDEWQVITSQPLPAEVPAWPAPTADQFSVAAFNAYNLDVTTDPRMAKVVASIGQMNGPTFLGMEEVDQDAVMATLISRLASAGYAYDYAYSPPDSRGFGVVALWRTDQVTSVATSSDYQGCSPYGSPSSTDDPLWATCQAIGQYPLFPRRPMIVTGTVTLGGEPTQVVVVANHLKSKLGGLPSDWQRLEQAQFLNDLVQQLAANGSSNVVVLGDLNDFEDAAPLLALCQDDALVNTWFTRPESERYSYIYRGVSQILDHILATPPLYTRLVAMDALHINADFPYSYSADGNVVWRTSDHDLIAATFGKEVGLPWLGGSSKTVTPAERVVSGAPLTYTITLSNGGATAPITITDTLPVSVTVDTADLPAGMTLLGGQLNWTGVVTGGQSVELVIPATAGAVQSTLTVTNTVAIHDGVYLNPLVIHSPAVSISPAYRLYLPLVRKS